MILQVKNRINSVERKVECVTRQSGRVEDEFASVAWQHICIVLSGNLEVCLREILLEFAKRRSHPAVARAVERRMRSFLNPKFEKIQNLLGEFDDSWSKEFEKFGEEERIKDDIDAIVNLRNNISHGKPNDVSESRIKEFLLSHNKTIEFVHKIVII